MSRCKLTAFIALITLAFGVALVGDALAAPQFPQFVRTTTWGHHTTTSSTIRGLAYDGHYYYIADINDHSRVLREGEVEARS